MSSPFTNSNSVDLLHPHLMESSYIIEYLKHRQLTIPNIEQKSRDELLKIFNSYAMPLHQRVSARTRNTDQMDTTLELTTVAQPANRLGSKHKRIIYESTEKLHIDNSTNSKSMALVTNGCKRIKLEAVDDGISENKRGLHDIKVDSSISQKTKRQKITWP